MNETTIMNLKYLLKKIVYALMGSHYEESENGYCITTGTCSFGVSFKPTTDEPEDN